MATQTVLGGSAAISALPGNELRVMTVVIDFGATTHTSSDVFEALEIPAGTIMMGCGIDLLTADAAGNSGTIKLTSSSPSKTYVDAATVASTGNMTGLSEFGETFIKFDSADTLDVTVATGLLDGVVRVWALVAYTQNQDDTQKVTFS